MIGNANGDPLGFVVPGGYVGQLLRLANRTVRDCGWTSMLSDVDVTNAPMMAAMERNGHRADGRPWHKWYYRRVKQHADRSARPRSRWAARPGMS